MPCWKVNCYLYVNIHVDDRKVKKIFNRVILTRMILKAPFLPDIRYIYKSSSASSLHLALKNFFRKYEKSVSSPTCNVPQSDNQRCHVRLPVRIERLGFRWNCFSEIAYWVLLLESCRENSSLIKSNKYMSPYVTSWPLWLPGLPWIKWMVFGFEPFPSRCT